MSFYIPRTTSFSVGATAVTALSPDAPPASPGSPRPNSGRQQQAKYIRRHGLQALFESVCREVNQTLSHDPPDPQQYVQRLFQRRLQERSAAIDALRRFRTSLHLLIDGTSTDSLVSLELRRAPGGLMVVVEGPVPFERRTTLELSQEQAQELVDVVIVGLFRCGALSASSSSLSNDTVSSSTGAVPTETLTVDERLVPMNPCPGIGAGKPHPEVRRVVNAALSLCREWRFTETAGVSRHVSMVF